MQNDTLQGRHIVCLLVQTGLMCSLICLPVLLFQLSGWMAFCYKAHVERPWCSTQFPNIYTFVQSHYWSVGPFVYFKMQQVTSLPLKWIRCIVCTYSFGLAACQLACLCCLQCCLQLLHAWLCLADHAQPLLMHLCLFTHAWISCRYQTSYWQLQCCTCRTVAASHLSGRIGQDLQDLTQLNQVPSASFLFDSTGTNRHHQCMNANRS